MKGQMNIEFIASVFIFGILIAYVTFYVYEMLPVFSTESRSESLRSKAYQISELLIGDPGLNSTDGTIWNSENVKRVGLSLENESYTLNWSKVIEFNKTDYKKIREGFYPEYELKIKIENVTNNQLVSEKGKIEAITQVVNIIRIAPVKIGSDYNTLRIIVSVWKV